ncbi:hypothetical protein C8J57DRAFT_1284471 [Mycena rebaudengoi]|nr:hypothetical protein C8J57DRAFT_1284471 [Mycena rebaudengoi]
MSWGAYLLGYLLMCWGGTIASHLLLGLPPPQLYLLAPWINYSLVHLLLTVFFHYVPTPDPFFTNLLLCPLDGLLRANSVTLALSLLSRPSINPLLVASPLFHFILGAAASSGGGLLGGTLSLWTDDWHFSTPPPLRSAVWGIWSTLDVWGGGVVAATYSMLTDHPAFVPVHLANASSYSPHTPHDAKVWATALMIALFALRVAAAAAATPVAAKKPVKKTN